MKSTTSFSVGVAAFHEANAKELRNVQGGAFSVLRADNWVELQSKVAALIERYPGILKTPPDLTPVFKPPVPDPGPY